MRKTFFLILIAALCSVTSAWAENAKGIGDTIPFPKYLQNIRYDKNTNELYFDDTFQNGTRLERRYEVIVFYRTANSQFVSYAGQSVSYDYGEVFSTAHGSNYTACRIASRAQSKTSKGGATVLDVLSSLIPQCYENGYLDIRVSIQGSYYDQIGGVWHEFEDPTGIWYHAGLHNYVDINLPRLQITLSAPSDVRYGEQMVIESTIQAASKCQYFIQESNDGGQSWTTQKSGYLTAVQAREGTTVTYKRVITGNHETIHFRTRVYAFEYPIGYIHGDTSAVHRIYVKYPCVFYDENGTLVSTEWYNGGQPNVTFSKPKDCRDYKYTSALPVRVEEHEAYISMIMPACPVWIDEYTPTYQVDFYDADATLLKTEEVAAGEDATPPDMAQNAPAANHAQQAKTGTFTGWSKDYTNVHKKLKVFAKYDVYVDMDIDVAEHTCNRTDDWNFMSWRFIEFEGNKSQAMVGDQLTFRASVKTNTPVNVYFQTGMPMSNGEISWTTSQKVGEITGYDMNKVMTFDHQVKALVEYNNELPFEKSRYYRFYAAGAGTAENVYSDAMEIEMYYPLLIEADQEVCVMSLHGAFFYNGTRSIVPAQNGDTILISDHKGFNGAGLTFTRVNKPAYLQDGYTENGTHYLLGPGETETLKITTDKKVVWFDGVYGNGYPKQFDFSAQGLGKYNGYYAAVAKVGEAVLPPAEPEMDGYVFLGWKNETTTEYADDAYLNVPAVDDHYLEFTAQWKEIPAAPKRSVRFLGRNGDSVLDTQSVDEGENATPPAAPEVSGYHFTGWDKPYTTIKADMDITALYGENEQTWTVTYKNWDNSDLGTEEVNDGEAAQGVIATREGYTFTGWSSDISHVTSNITVTAQFAQSVYTIDYLIDGEYIFSEEVTHGEMPAAYQAVLDQGKPSTAAYTYTFDHWNPAIVAATADAAYDAIYTQNARTYTVTFQNWDHSFLEAQQVPYGTAATAPSAPSKEGYTFVGWDREFSNILADMVVTAVFEMTKDPATGIEEITAPVDRAAKHLIDGKLFIATPEGRIYNATGVQVR